MIKLATKFKRKNYLYLFLFFTLISCSTTSTIEPVSEGSSLKSYLVNDIIVLNKTGETYGEIDIVSLMKNAINKNISPINSNLDMNKASLEIYIVQYQEGNAFGRWLAPGLAKTILSVETSLKNTDGEILLQSQVTRSVGAGGGYTIGAWSKVFEDVAKKIVEDYSLYK